MANPGARSPAPRASWAGAECVRARVCARVCMCVCHRTYIGWGIFFFFLSALSTVRTRPPAPSLAAAPWQRRGARLRLGPSPARSRRLESQRKLPGSGRAAPRLQNDKPQIFLLSPFPLFLPDTSRRIKQLPFDAAWLSGVRSQFHCRLFLLLPSNLLHHRHRVCVPLLFH